MEDSPDAPKQGYDSANTPSDTDVIDMMLAELLLISRGVATLVEEHASTSDYAETLGGMAAEIARIAERIDRPATHPMTPAQMAQAASEVRRADHDALTCATTRFDQAAARLEGVAVRARHHTVQRRALIWTSVTGVGFGCLLWALLPGAIARALPARWQVPERMAASTLALPRWEAGEHLMRTADQAGFGRIVAADRIVAANRKAINKCARAAAKAEKAVRCTVKVAPARW